MKRTSICIGLLLVILGACQPGRTLSGGTPTPNKVQTLVAQALTATVGQSQTQSAQTPVNTATAASATPIPGDAALLGDLTQIGSLGKGTVSSVFHSSDGKIAALLQDGTLRWFDASTKAELGSLQIDEVDSITFSPDDKWAVVEIGYGARMVNLETGKETGGFNGGMGYVTGFAWTPDSRYFAYLATDRTTGGPYHFIGLYDTTISGVVDIQDPSDHFLTLNPGSYHTMTAPAISPDGQLVAAGHSDKRVYVWDLDSGKTRFTLEGHAAEITSVDFNPKGGELASGSLDGTVRLWNTTTGSLVRVITGFEDDVCVVRYDSSGTKLVVSVRGRSDQLYDLQTGNRSTIPSAEFTPDPFLVPLHQQGYLSAAWFTRAAFSPDGRSLTLAQGSAASWDIASQSMQTAFETSAGTSIARLAFSPDGSRLAAVDEKGEIWVWDAHSGEVISHLSQKDLQNDLLANGQVSSSEISGLNRQGIAFSPDGGQVSFGNGPLIQILDLTGSHLTRFLSQILPAGEVSQVSYSADGKRIYAVLNSNQRAAIWDTTTGQLLREVPLTQRPSYTSDVDLNGPLLVRNNSDDQDNKWIEIWNLDSGQMARTDIPGWSVGPLRFSPDGRLLVGYALSQLYFWNAQTGDLLYQTGNATHLECAHDLAISPDDQTLAVTCDAKATLWDLSSVVAKLPPASVFPAPAPSRPPQPTPSPTSTPLPPTSPNSATSGPITAENAGQVVEVGRFSLGTIDQVGWSADGSSIFTAGSMGVYRYQPAVSTGSLNETARFAPDAWIYRVITTPTGQVLAAGTSEGKVRVWDVASGKVLVDLSGSGQPALSADGKTLVYQNSDGDLQTWNLETGQAGAVLHSIQYRESQVPVFSPDGRLVAAVQATSWQIEYDDNVRVWNAQTGAIVGAYGGPDNDITDLSFSADGKTLVGAAGGSAWVWDVQHAGATSQIYVYPRVKLEFSSNLSVYEQSVTSVALSPDNRTLAVGTSEKTVLLYDRASRTLLRKLNGPSGTVRHLSFSPDGASLLASDNDGVLLLWEVASGKRLAANFDHTGPVQGLAQLTDGSLTAWGEGAAWFLQLPNGLLSHFVHLPKGKILAASPTGSILAVYSPYRMSLWNAQSGQLLQELEGEAQEPFVDYQDEGKIFRGFYAASFSTDGQHLLTNAAGAQWQYTKQADGSYQMTDQTPAPAQFADLTLEEIVQTSPDQRWTGRITHEYRQPYRFTLQDSTTEGSRSLPFDKDLALTGLAFSPDSKIAALSQQDGKVFLVDLEAMRVVATLRGHHGGVDHLLFTADGRYLITTGVDGTVRVWGLSR